MLYMIDICLSHKKKDNITAITINSDKRDNLHGSV